MKKQKRSITLLVLLFVTVICFAAQKKGKICVSGIYPSLAYFNEEGECGTGAVVPWANNLWVITYGPHKPFGSTDKLYQITPSLKEITRKESIGGTPANRMIHNESNQLFIGPYAIDKKGNVRVIPISDMPGRLTGMSRSISDPANKVMIATMEEGIYEVDVHSLKVNTWFKDGNTLKKEGAPTYHGTILQGAHGKGFYSGQGRYFFANNGENTPEAKINPRTRAGVLGEYDGKSWKQIRRNQFTEITSAGGIYGGKNPDTDPIWSIGWDYKSVLLGVRDASKGWTFFRLPKASNSYDGAHGWNTEWPRIRNVGTDDKPYYLMTMHGMFWHFPQTFTAKSSAGLRPLSSYLKVIGDFCNWNGRLVFGCDDAAQSEFLNKRKAKGKIAGPGQSQSNLWFTDLNQPSNTGTTDATGSVWQKDEIGDGSTSDPYLFAGWKDRTAWIRNDGNIDVKFTFEIDENGNNEWKAVKDITVKGGTSAHLSLDNLQGEWIRVTNDKATSCTVSFVYSDSRQRETKNNSIFNGLASIDDKNIHGGLLYALGNDKKKLGILSNETNNGKTKENGYYELDENMNIIKTEDKKSADFIREDMVVPARVVTTDKGSYLITDDSNRRWRLPLGKERYTELMEKSSLRVCREVSTERDLFNCGGTFYELPAENADGYAKIRPISTHNMQITDYASYRGMLVMSGTGINTNNGDGHIFTSTDGNCSIWAGAIDDLWKLGKPTGEGGPWVDDNVKANNPSDPYLIGYYDNKELTLSHKSDKAVTFTVETDPTGDGQWMEYATYTVRPGEKFKTELPKGFFARWIRFKTNTDANVTTWLNFS